MPIYEFYCPDCHTIFSFLARSAGGRKRPSCPRCDRPKLEKRVSSFAISKGRSEPAGEEGFPDLDEAGMERAMASLAREAEGISEDDPRAMARLMRKFYQSSGMPMGEGMAEAMRRMEAGEDPEQIEEELGDLLEDEEALLGGKKPGIKGLRRRLRPPDVDDTLYEL
jgi:putative FmdB family regulatory protein